MIPPSSRGSAIIALFSMYSCSWWPTRYVPSMTTSAAASAASTSPRVRSKCANTTSEASGSNTGASGSVRSRTRRRASRRVSRSGAASRATGSAWCRISPPTGTRIGWSCRDAGHDVPARDVVRRDHGDARPVEARVEVDAGQARPGVRRPDRRAVPRAREHQVVGVGGGPGQLGRTLAPGRRATAPRAGGPTWGSRRGGWLGWVARATRPPRGCVDRQRGDSVDDLEAWRPAARGVKRAGPSSVAADRCPARQDPVARIQFVRCPVPAAAPGPGWPRCARRRPRPGPR